MRILELAVLSAAGALAAGTAQPGVVEAAKNGDKPRYVR